MEIDSPPFPKDSTSPEQLFWTLSTLFDWTLNQEAWANMEASRLKAPEDPFVPKLSSYPPDNADRYLNLDVKGMYATWSTLRLIRERYDVIVRNFESEDDWESDICIYHRIGVVRAAANLLSIAFLDNEKREAKENELKKQQLREFFKSFRSVVGDMQEFFAKEENADDDDEIDYDSLFNPPDGK